MSDSLGVVPVRERFRNGKSYSNEIQNEAFDIWAANGQNLTKTAKVLNIPLRTLNRWMKENKWREQFSLQADALPQNYVKARGMEILDDAITRLHKNIVYGGDRDSNAAIKIFTDIMGINLGGPQVVVNNDNRSQTAMINGIKIESVEDIKKILSGNLEQNIIDVETSRRSKD